MMTKTIVSLFALSAISLGALAADTTRATLEKIAQNADVANGSANVTTYKVSGFDVDAALAKDVAQAKKHWGAGCGPYKTTNYRRDSIATMRKFTNDKATADALEDLYNDDKIAKMYTILTNNNVECSQMWVEVYTVDGLKLDLWYGMGD